ncbi:hypothetical protein [Listeria fleischmannii]|uniref:hypothetical protein n=1 Tax=Listeria fleischmannii TaxID=1069827 RepID=UPI0004AF4DED|nr:hypothetical protein [Listeria fleischmannii]
MESEFQQSQRSILESQIKITNTSTKTYGQDIERIKKSCKEAGLSYRDLVEDVDKQAQIAAKSNTMLAKSSSDMSDDVVDANQRWNSLVFDPKTGKLKTNAKEEIQKASQSKDGWNNLKFIMQNANLSTNAKATMAYALMENEKWNSLSFKEQEMLTVYDPSVVKNALVSIGQWDKLTPKQQKLLMDSNTPAQVENALKEIGLWNKIPNPLKKYLRADNHDLVQAVNTSGDAIVKYNNKKVSLKKLLGDNKNVISKLNQGKNVIVEYNGRKVSLKKLLGDNQNLLSKLSNGKITISDYNKNFNPLTKTLSLITDSLNGVTGRISEIDRTWSNFRPRGKDLTISAVMNTPGIAKKLGTNYHKGGPALVNDAMGSNYRELITTPSGFSFIPEGRNVTLDLPKGSSVLRGDKTASLLKNMPKYAKGVGDFKDTNFMRVFESLIGSFSSEKGNNVFQAELTIPFDSNELKKQTEIIEKNNKKQDLIINLLNQLVLKDPTVTAKAIISEREIGEAANRHLGKQYRTIPGMNNF